MEFTQILGVSGAITYLLSYVLLQLRFIKGEGYLYAFLNMAAATLVLISLSQAWNIGSFIIQISFIGLSLYAIFTGVMKRRHLKISKEAEMIAKALFPNLPPRRAYQVIRLGVIKSGKDHLLAKQDHVQDEISVLLSGSADIIRDGKKINTVGPGQAIGEFSYIQGKPACADVRLRGQAQYFRIATANLRKVLKKNDDIAASFSAGITKQLVAKLT